jgi:hypothetical protein
MSLKPKIFKPKGNLPFPNQHVGDTFREIIDLWKKDGFVTVEETDSPFVSMSTSGKSTTSTTNGRGNILLYDRPNLDWLDSNAPVPNFDIALFGNPNPPKMEFNGNNSNWIFWGRSPKILEQYAKNTQMSYDQRPFESIFVGNVENQVQEKFRSPQTWKTVISKFELTNGNKHKYSQREYLHITQRAKFGLCLRGFGPKCNREIELLALGVIPLITDDVSLNYYDPLIEGLHYFKINSPEDVPTIIKNCSKEQWEVMSKACRDWYWRNASIKGSFETTMKIIRKFEKNQVKSISTMGTISAWNDLDILLKSIELYNRELPVYIGTDELTVEKLMNSSYKDTLTLKIVNCLDEYTGKTRQQMEQEGIWLEFMLRKCDPMDVALLEHDNTLFVDCDTCFLQKINHEDFNCRMDVGRSYHDIKTFNENQYGKYNGGCVFVNHTAFTTWWKLASQYSRYFEQACLEDTDLFFKTFDIPTQYNYGWWRLFECPEGQLETRKKLFENSNSIITYNQKPLMSIHTHFDSNFVHTLNFNKFVMSLSSSPSGYEIFEFIKKVFPVLYPKEIPKSLTPVLRPPPTLTTPAVSNDSLIHLIFQYCNTNNLERQKEYNTCVETNLNNGKIAAVYNMKEPNVVVPPTITNHPKYHEVPLDHWLKFKDVFEYANEHLHGKIVAVCNLDIFFDPNSPWEKLNTYLPEHNMVLCLSRHEFDGGNKATRDPSLQVIGYANSQDAWVFKAPLFIPSEQCDFELGRPGCDNAIAHRIKTAKYLPFNPSNEYRIFHYDICRGKTGANYLQKTYEEEHRKNTNVFPEEDGCYLLPDKDWNKSIDLLIGEKFFKLNEFQRYEIVCDIMSKYMIINNRPRE